MPSVHRLRIELRLEWLIVLSAACFLLVICSEFSAPISQLCSFNDTKACWVFHLVYNSGWVGKEQAAFLVVVTWLFMAGILVVRKKLSAKSLPALSRLVSELAYQQKYSELVDLLEPQLSLINAGANRLLWQAKLFDRVERLDPDNFSNWGVEEEGSSSASWKSMLNHRLRYGCSFLTVILPSGNRTEQAAEEIFRVLFQSHVLIDFIAVHRPKFGIQVLSCQSFGIDDFCETFFASLLENRSSSLYSEIRQNENLSHCGYVVPEHNQLLHFLFNDAKVAERLSVWKPIGEKIIFILSTNRDPKYIAFLNGPADSFRDQERWRDPTFVAIRFFDIMVAAAACQGIQWHMWLYYFPPILEELVKDYDATGGDVDLRDEWPTRGSYLIYAIFSALTGWIDIVDGELPASSPHLTFQNLMATHENGNIPKTAALALGHCLQILIMSKNIGESFQVHIYNIIVGQIRQLQSEGVEGRMRQILINAVIGRGALGTETKYGAQLKKLLQRIDHVHRGQLKDYIAALNKAYP